MLTRRNPETVSTTVTIEGQDERISFGMTCNNLNQDQIKALLEEAQGQEPDDSRRANALVLLRLVRSIETEYPKTVEGVLEMENDRPGIIEAIFTQYHRARVVSLAKN